MGEHDEQEQAGQDAPQTETGVKTPGGTEVTEKPAEAPDATPAREGGDAGSQ